MSFGGLVILRRTVSWNHPAGRGRKTIEFNHFMHYRFKKQRLEKLIICPRSSNESSWFSVQSVHFRTLMEAQR